MSIGSFEAAALRRIDRRIWVIVATVGTAVLAAPLVSNFSIAWVTFAPPAAIGAALVAGAWFYWNIRRDPKLASGLECTAQVIAFAAVGAPLSYLAAAAGAAIPLQDHVFDSIDRAMGFDWMALLGWMNTFPATFGALRLVYGSLLPQMALAVLCLAFTGRLMWLRVYVLAFLLATLISIAISAALPA
jgi:hypothetical protein